MGGGISVVHVINNRAHRDAHKRERERESNLSAERHAECYLTGSRLERENYSDPQGEKGACDRIAATVEVQVGSPQCQRRL